MWTESNNSLNREFKFVDFKQAFSFMTEVAFHAETMDHHPNWSNVYNTVSFSLNTHDAGNIVTEKDRDLAEKINAVYSKYSQ